MSNSETFTSIETQDLETVAGAAGSTDDQLLTMLNSIGSSIKDLASNKNSSNDQLMPMMFMMLALGGGGGGGGGAVVAPAAPQTTVVNVNARFGRRARKCW